MSAHIAKSLERHALAAGGAFAFREEDYELRYHPPVRVGRLAAFLLTATGGLAALAHQFGWTSAVASLGGWRSVG